MTQRELLEEQLTEKQVAFCKYYLYEWDAEDAAIKAGYAISGARPTAHELLKNKKVRKYINLLKADIEEITKVSRLKIIDELAKIAFSNIAHLHNTWMSRKEFEEIPMEHRACIESIETREKNGIMGSEEQVKVKLYSKIQALKELKDIMGYKETTRIDLTTDGEKIDLGSLSTEELTKRLETIKNITKKE